MALNAQREAGLMCDVTLRSCEGENFTAHRSLLAASSPYFRGMFQKYNFSESRNNSVTLYSVSQEGLAAILDFIYTGQISINPSNVYSILSASDHTMMTSIRQLCSQYMTDISESTSAYSELLRIWKSSTVYNLFDLKNTSRKKICQNFNKMSQVNDFSELTKDDMKELLRCECQEHSDEFAFWCLAVAWVLFDQDSRQNHVEELMSDVRFALIQPSSLISSVVPHYLMKNSQYCQTVISEAMQYQIVQNNALSGLNTYLNVKPRCSKSDTIIYLLSGLDYFWCYIPHHDKWHSLQPPPHNLAEPGEKYVRLLSAGGLVYVSIQNVYPEAVEPAEIICFHKFDMDTFTWKTCSVPDPNGDTGVQTSCRLISTDGSVYAYCRNHIKRYNSGLDQWEIVSTCFLGRHELVVAESNVLHFYGFEDGVVQSVNLNTGSHVISQEPVRFVAAEIRDITQLQNNVYLLYLRTISGVSLKVFNVKTYMWQDATTVLQSGESMVNPTVGVRYPACLDPADQWLTVCDQSKQSLFVMPRKSSLSGLSSSLPANGAHCDATLPFLRYCLRSHEWYRCASLPEGLSTKPLQMCINQGTA